MFFFILNTQLTCLWSQVFLKSLRKLNIIFLSKSWMLHLLCKYLPRHLSLWYRGPRNMSCCIFQRSPHLTKLIQSSLHLTYDASFWRYFFPELFRNNKNYATMPPEQRFTRTGSGKGQPSSNVTTSPNAGTVKRPPRPRIKSTPKTTPTSKKSRKKRPKFRELKA